MIYILWTGISPLENRPVTTV